MLGRVWEMDGREGIARRFLTPSHTADADSRRRRKQSWATEIGRGRISHSHLHLELRDPVTVES